MDDASQKDITRILADCERGDESAAARLMPLVYDRLCALAGSYFKVQAPGQTLQPTALVHEAFLRLARPNDVSWESRAHFFAVAAKAMRQILANHARDRRAAKRGGGAQRITLTGVVTPTDSEAQVDLIDLDDALSKLAELSPRQARIVEMRFLTGLDMDEIAHVLAVSTRTVERDWSMARAFLKCELKGGGLS